jgi:polysaccharide biosynthesis/export protein
MRRWLRTGWGVVGLVAVGIASLSPAGLGNAEDAKIADYVIGIDDILHILVWGNKELDQDVVVRPDGRISFPLAGELEVHGLTVPELTKILTERLAKSVRNPNVSVMVKEMRSFRVYFIGRVQKPGVYPIKAGTPLLEALTLAGGPTDGADLPAAYVIRHEKKIPVDLRRLIQAGDLTKNILLQTGDTVVLPQITIGENPQEVFDQRIYVLGKVQKPGVYTIKRPIPILHALFLAGGLADGAEMASAFVVRDGKKIPVNLWQLIQKGDVSQNLEIKHEDTIVVPLGGDLQNAVYVMGEVMKPGIYPQPERLTLLKVITLAGGFTKYAAKNRVELIRRDGEKKTLLKVNLKDVINDPEKHEDISLEPGDVVIVPESLF